MKKMTGLKPSKNGGKMNTVNPPNDSHHFMSASQQASGLESYGDGSSDDIDYRAMKKKKKR